MAGIAMLLDLLRKNPSFSTQTLHSYGLFSATAAASAAAASVAAGRPFASRVLFGDGGISVALSDAGAEWTDDYISNLKSATGKDYISNLRSATGNFFHYDSIKHSTKEYPINLKPLFSAFGLRPLAMTSLRSFLMFYLPLLEPRSNINEDDDDFLQDSSEEEHVDLVVPFKKSVKQIVRETTVVTTRRVLERLAVHYVSQRMAWKLLKDVPKSAKRKAQRGMPTFVYFYGVSKTTFRGHLLGVVASWIVQVGIEMYRCFSRIANAEEGDKFAKSEQLRVLGKRVSDVTIRCGASLVFASIGAGMGALFHPSAGQWIGAVAVPRGAVRVCIGLSQNILARYTELLADLQFQQEYMTLLSLISRGL